MTKLIKSAAEFSELINGPKTAVVDFFAEWCGPCKVISPVFQSLAPEFPSIEFAKMDVDQVPDVAESSGIRAMPTFQVYKGGKKVDELVGANQQKLRELLEKFK